ncbi:MAG: CDP-alcohol phosphatidyltransferase family protein [Gemmatimonadota bacterium]
MRPEGGPKRARPLRWLPNTITLARIALVVAYLFVMAAGTAVPPAQRRLALVVLGLAGASDVLDGFLARRFALTTRTGMILDTFADRFAQLAVTYQFVFVEPRLHVAFLALLLIRDVLGVLGARWALRRGHWEVLAHESHGRLATVLLFVLFVLLTLGAADRWIFPLAGVAAATVAVSTARYLHRGVRRARGASLAVHGSPT